jgi:ABC-type nickel/cobalt efflux system permease component RcnA
VQWAEGVVDNEGLGRKSSKGTHARRTFLIILCPKLYHIIASLSISLERNGIPIQRAEVMLTVLVHIVCCIYHRPKKVDESSDESSSDSSSSDSDSDSEPERKRKVGGGKDDCNHNHDHDHDHSHSHKRGRRTNGKKKRTPSPNAYEKIPKQKPKDTKQEDSK